ncbi:hypothetical protein IKF73_00270 [Candidatus Saccharibacteria bacterium]|nr:hypothetical protein [Candidatus Saccharibacteria bacterium]
MLTERIKSTLTTPGKIIKYLGNNSKGLAAEDIGTLFDLLDNNKATTLQDLIKFLKACAETSAFFGKCAPKGTLDKIFKALFEKYPEEIICAINETFCGFEIPESTTNAIEVYNAVFSRLHAAPICDILITAIEKAETKGIKGEDTKPTNS